MNDITRTIQADGENHTVTTVAGDTGTITLDGHLDGSLTVVGHGNVHAIRSGRGNGDAIRSDSGDGYARRTDSGYGDAIRTDSGHGFAFCEAGARRLTSPTSGSPLLIDVQHGTVRCGCFMGTLQELTDTARDDLPPAHWAHKLTADNLAVITQQELVA